MFWPFGNNDPGCITAPEIVKDSSIIGKRLDTISFKIDAGKLVRNKGGISEVNVGELLKLLKKHGALPCAVQNRIALIPSPFKNIKLQELPGIDNKGQLDIKKAAEAIIVWSDKNDPAKLIGRWLSLKFKQVKTVIKKYKKTVSPKKAIKSRKKITPPKKSGSKTKVISRRVVTPKKVIARAPVTPKKVISRRVVTPKKVITRRVVTPKMVISYRQYAKMNFGNDADISPFADLTPDQINVLTEQIAYARNQHTVQENAQKDFILDRIATMNIDDFITILTFVMPDGIIKTNLLNIHLPRAIGEISAGAFIDMTNTRTIKDILNKNTDGAAKNIFAAKLLSKIAKLDTTSILEKMAKQGFTVPNI